jgi:hypothetical protein
MFRAVSRVPGLEVSYDGQFLWHGKPKLVSYPTTVTGKPATAKLQFQNRGKRSYYQASKLVAETWLFGFTENDFVIYKDGNCHNIGADNLEKADAKEWDVYMRRNSVNRADTLAERKRKLQLVADESLMTLHYFETLSMDEINKHVKSYLYPCLMQFAMKTLQFGEQKSKESVAEVIGTMYEKIMNGMCLYNYERFCKKMLHNLKRKGNYGEYWHDLCKPIQIEVEQLKLDCLWERYKVTRFKK